MIEGRAFLNRDTERATVLVVDGENPDAELHRRLHRLGYAAVADRVAFWQAEDAIFSDDLDTAETVLREMIDEPSAGLMVLDSQRALWYGAENEAEAVRPFYAMLRRVARATGAAIVVLHHDNKAGGYSGSTDLNAGVDSRLHLVREDDGRTTLKHEKCRAAPEQPPLAYRLHLEGDRYAFELLDRRSDRDLADQLLDYLGDEWLTLTEIAAGVRNRRVDVEPVLRELTRDGVVEYAKDPAGRAASARCWRLSQATGQAGQPGDQGLSQARDNASFTSAAATTGGTSGRPRASAAIARSPCRVISPARCSRRARTPSGRSSCRVA
jgi:hypothetical protein